MTDPTPPPAPESPPPASGWAAPAPAAPVPGAAGFVYADVPNRVFALIIDAVILFVAYIVVAIVLGAIGLASGGIGPTSTGFNFVGAIVLGLVLAVINAAYFIWSWTSMRATFGMRALGMQVGNAYDGKTLTMDQALRRGVALWGPQWAAQFLGNVPVVGILISLLAFVWVLFLLYTTATSPTKQGWHDKFANSVVVKAGRVA
jgi:uncharacterized RDD family membrane protein YckC